LNLEKLKKEINELNIEIHDLQNIIDFIHELQIKITDTITDIKSNKAFIKNGLLIDDLIMWKFDISPIQKIINNLKKEIVSKEKEIVDTQAVIEFISNQTNNDEKKLTSKEKLFNDYLKEHEKWKNILDELMGESTKKDTIKYWEDLENYLNNQIEKEYTENLNQRNTCSLEIIKLLKEKMGIYPEIYSYAKIYSENKADDFHIDIDEFLQFNSKITLSPDFDEKFLEFTNQKIAGTFYTYEKAHQQLSKIKGNINFNNNDSILSFPSEILEALKYDKSKSTNNESEYEAQILEGRKQELYNYLFGFSYLDIRFNITFSGKPISFLSPGEKGTLLIIFYLLIDKDKRPIIIDQPEENLDNETVAKKLVPFLKTAKKDRQIIIVTHNPNLAVVCDSEQIIYANLDKNNKNLISYNSGSIENFGIREKVIDVLEGTKEAFNNRELKYIRR
jgi:hypothetical protein